MIVKILFCKKFHALPVAIGLVACGGGGDDAPGPASSASAYTAEELTDVYALTGQEADQRFAAVIDRKIAAEPGSSGFFRAVKEAGGMEAFLQLVADDSSDAAKELLARHGVGFTRDMPTGDAMAQRMSAEPGVRAQNVSDCIQVYPPADRDKTFAFGSHTVHIDSYGRPGVATWTGGPGIPVGPGTRTGCQTTVGKWGVAGDVGGHLIPAALGGWGGRANLVPQNGEMNNGPWRTVENVPSKCRLSRQTTYIVTPKYLTPLDIRPARLDVKLIVHLTGIPWPLTAGAVGMPNIAPTPQILIGLTQNASKPKDFAAPGASVRTANWS
ncbi:MAG: DNA/RNA non-specific endonuclease [Roseateles sp.]|uniref:DNA/RNA non-specific endonuclease n=1 Tax=Roseateles sp. TaxID=1971397 RepID=UPI0039E8AF46